MEKQIVVIEKNELRAGTWIMSAGFGVEHRALTKLVAKYKSDFEEFGIITSPVQQMTGKRGRQINEYLLNEEQAMYLGTLLTNNSEVRKFKIKLVKEFGRMKKELLRISSQRTNAEWLEAREKGKETRLIETDTIKLFVDYAKGQGSQNAERYYANISTMENKALFLIEQKYKNLREVLDHQQLSTIKVADRIVIKALKEGMEKEMPYKAIYLMAKDNIETFAGVIGKSLIPHIDQQLAIE